MSDFLQPHELQHDRLPCPSLSPWVCWNSGPLIESMMPSNYLIICHPLLPLPSIFPSISSFPISQLFTSGGQGIGASASASVLPKNIIQGWFPLGLTSFISLLSKRYYQESSPAPQFESMNSAVLSLLLWSNCHIRTWLLEKP